MNEINAMFSDLKTADAFYANKAVHDAGAFHWATKYHLNSRGERMAFDDMAYLIALYWEIQHTPRMVVEKSVQCGLSELFIVESHREAAELGLTVMYVLPKYELRNRFVNNRVYKVHSRVPHYKQLLKAVDQRVHRISMSHFGKGTIAYVGSNVEDEFIEIPVDSAFVDEKDRCNLQNLLLLPDRYTASPYKYHREISNPTIEGFGIDARFLESSQGLWNIKCPRCGEWFSPDFWTHVVREVGFNDFIPRDEAWERGKEMRLIHDCGAPVNRLEGETAKWIDKYEDREWKGRRISKIFNKTTSLEEMYLKWIDSVGNDLKVQVFYNSDLGLPFTSAGAKITRNDLNSCMRKYPWPMSPKKAKGAVMMGVDVGSELNFILRDMVTDRGVRCSRLLAAGRVPSFKLLEDIIEEWQPRICVIDALPEIHKVMELKSKYSCVYSSRFQEGLRKVNVDKKAREVTMDRTALLDYVKQGVTQETMLLPARAEFLDTGHYYSQMTASTRVLEVDEKNPEKSKFVWRHSQADHFFLTEGYCLQAGMLLPNTDVFEFFDEQSKGGIKPAAPGMTNLTKKQLEEIERLEGISADQVLGGIQDKHGKNKVK